MQPEQIIGQLLGALVGRKRSRRSGLFGMAMTGRRGGGGLLTGGTLLTAAGLVWGALESMQKSTAPRDVSPATTPPPPPQARGLTPPPLPGQSAGPVLAPPPLPGSENAPEPDAATLLPLLQVAIAAARADGELSGEERQVIETHASTLGLGAHLAQILLHERQAPAVHAASFTTDEQRRAAYAIAWAVIRGDGVVSPGERMYLTQLSRVLRLPHEDVETIEREALGKEPS